MSFMRSFIAFTLLLIAMVLGFGGVGAHWLDRLARTPAPMQQIIGPLISDEQVVQELDNTLTTEAKAAVPEAVLSLPLVGAQIDALVSGAVDAALTDAGVQRAWNESINLSRAGYVAELDKVRGEEAMEPPTIWFNLTPFAELGAEKLLEAAPDALRPTLQELQPPDVRLALGQPSASMTTMISDGVGLAKNWPFLYLAAAVVALLGLLAGSRRGRWVALMLAGAVAAVGLWFGRSFVEGVSFPGGNSLAAAIRTTIVDGGTQHFLDFTQPATYVAYGAIGLGLAGLLIASLRRRD